MKKLLALLLASVLVISLFAGCTATNEAPKKETREKTDEMSMGHGEAYNHLCSRLLPR